MEANDRAYADELYGTIKRHLASGEFEQALEWSMELEKVLHRLARKKPEYRKEWIDAIIGVGILAHKLGKLELAVSVTERGVEELHNLILEDHETFLPLLATALSHLAIYLHDSGKAHDALAKNMDAIDIYGLLVILNPDNETYQYELALNMAVLGEMLAQLKRHDDAKEAFKLAAGFLVPLVQSGKFEKASEALELVAERYLTLLLSLSYPK